jgi:Uma2 family endonuclease
MFMPSLELHWTVDDLARLPDDGNRYEIIDGELFVTPAPTMLHQRAVGELFALLREYLQGAPVGLPFVAPVDVVYSPRRAVQPDVLVVPRMKGRLPDRLRQGQPLLLAAEVLSPSTRGVDRIEKRHLYRDEGVPEYWIVDLDARAFERSIPTESRTEILTRELVWHPAQAITPLVIDIAAYFTTVLDD